MSDIFGTMAGRKVHSGCEKRCEKNWNFSNAKTAKRRFFAQESGPTLCRVTARETAGAGKRTAEFLSGDRR